MILDDEDFEAKKFNSYWAGRLIDLPKDDAWEIAGEIAEAIEYALRQANGVYMSSEALPIADVVGRSEQVKCPYCKRDEPCKGSYPEGCFHPNSKGI
jgi:hypothetical protein